MRKPLVLLTIAVALALTSACGPMTLDPRKKEFWVGGTDDKEIRERSQPIADAAYADATRYQAAFLDCMQAYGASHATAKATATEVAQAGMATCAVPLASFTDAVATAGEHTWYATVGAKESYRLGPSKGAELAKKEREVLADHGRRVAIKAIVDAQ